MFPGFKQDIIPVSYKTSFDMDKLGTFLKTLSLGEKISFRNSLKIKYNGKDNKKLLLFDLLIKEKSSIEIRQIIYRGHNNPESAYYQLRKSLVFELENFLIQSRIWTDHRSEVYRKIDVAHYFTGQLQYNLAWSYLNEAEELAITNGFVEILNVIYSLKVYIAEREPSLRTSLPELVEQKMQNLDLLKELVSISFHHPNEPNHGQEKLLKDLQPDHVSNNTEPVMLKQIGLIYKHRQLPKYFLNPFKSFMDKVLNGNNSADYSLQNQLHHNVVQSRLCLKTRQFDDLALYLDKLDRLLKTHEATPLSFVIETTCLKIELLICQGKLHEALERTEKAWDKYFPLLSLEFRLHFIILLINTHFLSYNVDGALKYFEVLEEYKEQYVQLHREDEYNNLLLLKAALLFEQQENYGVETLLNQLEVALTDDTGQLALSILRNMVRSGSQPALRNVQFLMTRFLRECTADSDPLLPDFGLWVKSRLESTSYYEAFLDRLKKNPKQSDDDSSKRPILIGDLSIPHDFLA